MERVPDIVATGQRWMNKKTVWAQYGKENYTSVHQTAAAAAKSGQKIGITVKRSAIPLSDPSRIYIHGRVVTLLHSQSNCSNSIRFNFKNDKKYLSQHQEQEQRKGATTSSIQTTYPRSACVIDCVLLIELIPEHSAEVV